MDMKRQINMCLFMFMLLILIGIKFDVDINNDELIIILEHNNKKIFTSIMCSNAEPN
jgi:predicted transglutaminase-like protease